jgi:hypothetical protein
MKMKQEDVAGKNASKERKKPSVKRPGLTENRCDTLAGMEDAASRVLARRASMLKRAGMDRESQEETKARKNKFMNLLLRPIIDNMPGVYLGKGKLLDDKQVETLMGIMEGVHRRKEAGR